MRKRDGRVVAPLVGAAGAVVVAAGLIAACGSSGAGGSSGAAQASGSPAANVAAHPTTTVPALRVTAVTPGPALPTFTSAVTVAFSSPLAAGAATPTITPAVSGTWAQSGSTMTFTPTAGWAAYARETVTVPAGVHDADGGTLATPVAASFTTGAPSVLRLQEVLASLGYLPVTFAPSAPAVAAPLGPVLPGATQPGHFAWASPAVPAGLSAQWVEGQPNGITRGGVMAFEADHGLVVDGSAGPQVWAALATAVAHHQVDPRPYDYIMVTESRPETLSVWQGGKIVYTSLANTGVPGASTALGTFPVYERFVTTTMSGTNPDGSKYKDPGIPWVAYFNGGDAIHGFVRGGYGYPQSDGCVELPPSHAQVMYPLDYYGTLVTVS